MLHGMKSLALERQTTETVAPGEKLKEKIIREPQFFIVDDRDFPQIAQTSLDRKCKMMVEVKVVGRPEYGDNREHQVCLELVAGEIVGKENPERKVRKELGY